MNDKNTSRDGGPAFPKPIGWNGLPSHEEHEESREEEGMSLRQYFAAHAPMVQAIDSDGDGTHEPPFWYEHSPRPKFPGPSESKEDRDRKTAEFNAQIKAWERERFFSWRWYYADQMLKTGEK